MPTCPPKDQALVIVKEADGYKFGFLIFPKKSQAGTITELMLNATYRRDGQPYPLTTKPKLSEA